MSDEKQWFYNTKYARFRGGIERYEIIKRTAKTVLVKYGSWENGRRIFLDKFSFFSLDDAIQGVLDYHLKQLEIHQEDVAKEQEWFSNSAQWEVDLRARFANSEPQG